MNELRHAVAATEARKPFGWRTGFWLACGVLLVSCLVSPGAWARGPLESYLLAGRELRAARFGPHVYDDAAVMEATAEMTGGRIRDFLSPSPPSIAVVMLPFAALPAVAVPAAWAIVNAVALVGTLWLIVSSTRWPRQVPALDLALVFLLPLSAPFRENLARGQIYLLMMLAAAAIVAGCARQRALPAAAGLCGLMLVKLAGWPIILTLVAARAGRVLALTAAIVALIGISMLPWIGIDTWRVYVLEVLPAWLAPAKASVTAYQTVPGFFAHLFRFDPAWNPRPVANVPAIALIATTAIAVAGVAMLWRIARRGANVSAVAGALILTVVLSPVAEQYHYLMTVPAAAVLLDVAAGSRPRLVLWMAAMALLLTPLPFKSAAFAHGWSALLAYPRLYGAALLWILAVAGGHRLR